MMAIITVTYGAHAPVTITTGGAVAITIDDHDIKVRHDGKVDVFPTEATQGLVSVVLPK
jgi:hypothetical protein